MSIYYNAVEKELNEKGFVITAPLYNSTTLKLINGLLEQIDSSKATVRKSAAIFAVRQVLKEFPALQPVLLHTLLMQLIEAIGGRGMFVVKSIYFDKPGSSNWFVSYHQDLTITVAEKANVPGFNGWIQKQGQYSVQPPLNISENIITARIHLDDTDEHNGALRVVPGSHRNGIYRPENIDWTQETETVCNLSAGSVMLMKPLLLHSSSKTTNQKRRRVFHLEFCSLELPAALHWSERIIKPTISGQ